MDITQFPNIKTKNLNEFQIESLNLLMESLGGLFLDSDVDILQDTYNGIPRLRVTTRYKDRTIKAQFGQNVLPVPEVFISTDFILQEHKYRFGASYPRIFRRLFSQEEIRVNYLHSHVNIAPSQIIDSCRGFVKIPEKSADFCLGRSDAEDHRNTLSICSEKIESGIVIDRLNKYFLFTSTVIRTETSSRYRNVDDVFRQFRGSVRGTQPVNTKDELNSFSIDIKRLKEDIRNRLKSHKLENFLKDGYIRVDEQVADKIVDEVYDNMGLDYYQRDASGNYFELNNMEARANSSGTVYNVSDSGIIFKGENLSFEVYSLYDKIHGSQERPEIEKVKNPHFKEVVINCIKTILNEIYNTKNVEIRRSAQAEINKTS